MLYLLYVFIILFRLSLTVFHNSVRPCRMIYKCVMCDTVFTQKPLLYMHFDTHLAKQKVHVFKCPDCTKLYAQKGSMMEHIKVSFCNETRLSIDFTFKVAINTVLLPFCVAHSLPFPQKNVVSVKAYSNVLVRPLLGSCSVTSCKALYQAHALNCLCVGV